EVAMAFDRPGDPGGFHEPCAQLPDRVDLDIGDRVGGPAHERHRVVGGVPPGLGGLGFVQPAPLAYIRMRTKSPGVADVRPAPRRTGASVSFPPGWAAGVLYSPRPSKTYACGQTPQE